MIEIILFACIGVLLQEAEPIIMIKRHIGFKEESYDDQSKIMKFIHRLLYCAMCLTFWVALISTLNPTTAIISSVLSAILHKKILE
jgi:uncharacterized membrane protein